MSNSLLIFTSYYLPGFKAGGPIRSISSFINNLNSNFEISIITRNYDIGDSKNIYSIKPNIWHIFNNHRCLYLSYFSFFPSLFNSKDLNKNDYKYIYFNSFFDLKFSILPLLYFRLMHCFGRLSNSKIVLAPRGEFSSSALNRNRELKKLVIFFFKFLSISEFITWHATSKKEEQDIQTIFGLNLNLICLENFPSSNPVNLNEISFFNKTNVLKIIFVGRVSPMKNLLVAFHILKNVKSNVVFDIYGPIEDLDYYFQCNLVVKKLPNNVSVNFCGVIKHSKVQSTLLRYDLFFSPTLGENYGHSIVEAFLVGCPVLISNNTPWKNLGANYAGFDISLDNLYDFSSKIDYFANLDIETFRKFKLGSYKYGIEISNFSIFKKRLFRFIQIISQKNMIILITGVAGFIGFHTAKFYLEKGYVVVGIDNLNDYYDPSLKIRRLKELGIIYNSDFDIYFSNMYNFKFLKADISNWSSWETLKQFGITDVIHLAAQAGVRYSIQNPNAYIQSNVVGFQFLLNFCVDSKISQILYASSSSVYGINSIQPFDELDDCSKPESLYAATKRTNELMAYSFFKTNGILSIGLRFFTVYGPWGRPDMAPMLFAKAALNNESIDVFNNGNQSRDFTYIDDIINGIYLSHVALKENKIFGADLLNIGRGEPVKLMSFIDNLEFLFDVKLNKNYKEAQLGDVMETYSNTSKLKKLTGYEPKVDLNIGLRYFVEWYKKYYIK